MQTSCTKIKEMKFSVLNNSSKNVMFLDAIFPPSRAPTGPFIHLADSFMSETFSYFNLSSKCIQLLQLISACLLSTGA